MSKVQASAFDFMKAAAGMGQGTFQSDSKQSKEDDSKLIEDMFSNRDENIDLRKGNAQKFVNSFYNIGLSPFVCALQMSVHATLVQTTERLLLGNSD